MLRVANIPMEITSICGHSVAYFISEHCYMDHGDDPYNLDFVASGWSGSSLLIDEATFTSRFGSDLNNRDGDATMCGYIGWQTTH